MDWWIWIAFKLFEDLDWASATLYVLLMAKLQLASNFTAEYFDTIYFGFMVDSEMQGSKVLRSSG